MEQAETVHLAAYSCQHLGREPSNWAGSKKQTSAGSLPFCSNNFIWKPAEMLKRNKRSLSALPRMHLLSCIHYRNHPFLGTFIGSNCTWGWPQGHESQNCESKIYMKIVVSDCYRDCQNSKHKSGFLGIIKILSPKRNQCCFLCVCLNAVILRRHLVFLLFFWFPE